MAGDVKSDIQKHNFLSAKTTIDYRGRVYVPIKIRKHLNLRPHEEITLKCEGNTIILSPSRKRTPPEKYSI